MPVDTRLQELQSLMTDPIDRNEMLPDELIEMILRQLGPNYDITGLAGVNDITKLPMQEYIPQMGDRSGRSYHQVEPSYMEDDEYEET